MKYLKTFEDSPTFKTGKYPEKIMGFRGKMFFITTSDDKSPWERQHTTDYDEALRILNRVQSISTSDYCIYEVDFVPLTIDDIELRITSNKYNI